MSKLNNLSCSYQISQVILLVGNDNSAIDEFKSTLKSAFKIWDFGPANYFFWVWDYTQQHCYWEKYTLELLEDDGLLGCKPLSVPMELNFKIHLRILQCSRVLYADFCIWHITRLDITYDVHSLRPYMFAPHSVQLIGHYLISEKWSMRRLILLYFIWSSSYCFLWCNLGCLSGFSSFFYTTEYCVLLGDSLISWFFRKQPIISHSSSEAEYHAMADTTCELVWLTSLYSSSSTNCIHSSLW